MGSALGTLPAAESLGAPLLPVMTVALRVPSDVCTVALELLEPELTLRRLAVTGVEAGAALERAVPKRRAEFAAGRHAAALALAHYGCFARVSRAPGGEPCWPSGFCGSISHGGGVALAIVARNDAYRSLGVDVERVIAPVQAAEIASRIMSQHEFAVFHQGLPGMSANEHLSLGFSAKESLYKCLNPLAQEFIEFEAARVLRVEAETPSEGRITMALTRRINSEFDAGFELEARYAFAPDRVATTLWLTRSQES